MNYSQARNFFYFALVLSVPLKLALAHSLPLTGDEAYFVLWAKFPSLGHYDHPPLIGWMIHLCLQLHESEIFVRLPSILGGYVLVWGVYSVLKDQDKSRALVGASVLLLTPVYLLGIMVSTDTPLIVAMFLSVLSLYRAEKQDRYGMYILSGALLGLAFLSKYFAALLLLAYMVHFLRQGLGRLSRLGLVFMGCLPFVMLNLYWNYTHCWVNIMFNFVNRTQDGQVSLIQPLVLVAVLVWIMSPMLAVQMFRHHRSVRAGMSRNGLHLFAVAGLVPLAVFFVASWMYSVGVHWVLGFLPFLYVLYAQAPGKSLLLGRNFMSGYAVLHVLIAVTLLAMPLDILKDRPQLHRDAVFYLQPARVAEALEPLEADHYTTPSYSRSAVMSFYSGKYWGVLGTGSKYGREDDRLTDFRRLEGQDFIFLSRRESVDTEQLGKYFSRVETLRVQVMGTEFAVARGIGFDFQSYQEQVLTRIRKRYYDIPEFLPSGECFFIQRYFP